MSDRPVGLLSVEDMPERIDRIARYTQGALRLSSRSGTTRSLWHQIAGLRNRIVHAYFDVDVELVWAVVRAELPGLRASLTKLRQTGTTGG